MAYTPQQSCMAYTPQQSCIYCKGLVKTLSQAYRDGDVILAIDHRKLNMQELLKMNEYLELLEDHIVRRLADHGCGETSERSTLKASTLKASASTLEASTLEELKQKLATSMACHRVLA
jgi:hypothetical protein